MFAECKLCKHRIDKTVYHSRVRTSDSETAFGIDDNILMPTHQAASCYATCNYQAFKPQEPPCYEVWMKRFVRQNTVLNLNASHSF